MSRESTQAGMLGDLARLSAALNANAPDLAHVEGARARLEKIVTDAQELAKQQAAFRASKQDASVRLRATLVEGQRLANGLRTLLKEHYGVRSEKLAEFGLKPFRGRAAKPKSTEPETPKAPEVTPPASTPQPTPSPNDTNA